MWIYDSTHFPRAGVAATVVEDLVSPKWLAEIVSAEETATQVQVLFTDALEREGYWSGSRPARTAWSTHRR
jgi:putative transposase